MWFLVGFEVEVDENDEGRRLKTEDGKWETSMGHIDIKVLGQCFCDKMGNRILECQPPSTVTDIIIITVIIRGPW